MNDGPSETERLAFTLRLILGAMAGGICLLGAVVVFLYFRGAAVPQPRAVDNLRFLSLINAALTIILWSVSSGLYRVLLRPGTAQAFQGAVIARAAMREGSALFGLVACFLGASSGALRAQPVFWANALPAATFVAWIMVSRPDSFELRAFLDAFPEKR